jgi:serine/threonine protein kinase
MLCGFTPFWDSGSPVKIYENIIKGRVKYPPYMHVDAQDLLAQLITPDLTKRLGNLHAGPADVKNHRWFAEVTWERLYNKNIDAPYVPPVKGGQGDASQFDKYPEEPEEYGKRGDDPYVFVSPLAGVLSLSFLQLASSRLFANRNSQTRPQILRFLGSGHVESVRAADRLCGKVQSDHFLFHRIRVSTAW